MRRWSWLVPTVLAAGCWGERAPADTTPPPLSIASIERPPTPWPSTGRGRLRPRDLDRCTQAIGHMFDLARQDATSSGFTAAMLDEFQESTIESCHQTEWSADSLSCYEDTTSTSQMGECFRSMTADQKEDFEKRFMDVRLRHRNAPPPMPQPPSPSAPPAVP